MSEKKTTVVRVPNELIERINQYGKALDREGIKISQQSDLMRSFANQSVTPYDNAGEALKKIFKERKK